MTVPLVVTVGIEPRAFVEHRRFIESQVTAERGWWMLESPQKWCDSVKDAAVAMFGEDAVSKVQRCREVAQAFAHRVAVDFRSGGSAREYARDWNAVFADDVDSHGECFGCIALEAHPSWSPKVKHIDPAPFVESSYPPSAALSAESTPEALLTLLAPIIYRCKEMTICDPYLAASLTQREQETVAALVVRIARQLGDRGPLALHVGPRAGTLRHVRARLRDAAGKDPASQQAEINLTCWNEGKPGLKPHARWICTDRGGLALDYGIQDFAGDPRTIGIDRLSREKSRFLISESELAPDGKQNKAGWLYEDGDVFTV